MCSLPQGINFIYYVVDQARYQTTISIITKQLCRTLRLVFDMHPRDSFGAKQYGFKLPVRNYSLHGMVKLLFTFVANATNNTPVKTRVISTSIMLIAFPFKQIPGKNSEFDVVFQRVPIQRRVPT